MKAAIANIIKKEKKIKRAKKSKTKSKTANTSTAKETPGTSTEHADTKDPEIPESNPTYTKIREIRESEYEIENIFGDGTWTPGTGSFRNEGDNRALLTRESQDKAASVNSSFSYTYFNMYCCSCSNAHPLL